MLDYLRHLVKKNLQFKRFKKIDEIKIFIAIQVFKKNTHNSFTYSQNDENMDAFT